MGTQRDKQYRTRRLVMTSFLEERKIDRSFLTDSHLELRFPLLLLVVLGRHSKYKKNIFDRRYADSQTKEVQQKDDGESTEIKQQIERLIDRYQGRWCTRICLQLFCCGTPFHQNITTRCSRKKRMSGNMFLHSPLSSIRANIPHLEYSGSQSATFVRIHVITCDGALEGHVLQDTQINHDQFWEENKDRSFVADNHLELRLSYRYFWGKFLSKCAKKILMVQQVCG